MTSAVSTYDSISINWHAPLDVLQFISNSTEPFFSWQMESELSADTLFEINLLPESLPESFREITRKPGQSTAIDLSLYPHLQSSGIQWDWDTGNLFEICRNKTYVAFDKSRCVISIFQPDTTTLANEGLRILKTLTTSLIEKLGGIQLHASGVCIANSAVLMCGDMKQGKTTLLLELMSKFNVSVLSCDTTVVRETQSNLKATGWPSPFSVSHGAMTDYKPLHPDFPNSRKHVPYHELWLEGKKSVLETRDVVRGFGRELRPIADRIAAFIFINFSDEGKIGLEPIRSSADVAARLKPVYLGSRDPIYPNWLKAATTSPDDIEQSLSRFAQILFASTDVLLLSWAPSAESLLKRVPILGNCHDTLRQVLQL